jgi:hypothetical protein
MAPVFCVLNDRIPVQNTSSKWHYALIRTGPKQPHQHRQQLCLKMLDGPKTSKTPPTNNGGKLKVRNTENKPQQSTCSQGTAKCLVINTSMFNEDWTQSLRLANPVINISPRSFLARYSNEQGEGAIRLSSTCCLVLTGPNVPRDKLGRSN